MDDRPGIIFFNDEGTENGVDSLGAASLAFLDASGNVTTRIH